MSKQIISLTIHDHSSPTWNIPAYIYTNMLVLLSCAEAVGVGVLLPNMFTTFCLNILKTSQLVSSQSHYNTAIIVASINQGSMSLYLTDVLYGPEMFIQ